MLKQDAIELLGGDITKAARAVGITYNAVRKWPDVLPPCIADRVLAAVLRRVAKHTRIPDLKAALAAAEVGHG